MELNINLKEVPSNCAVLTSLNKKAYEEVITSHSVTILILSRCYYNLKSADINELIVPCRRGICILFEYFLHCPDLTYTEFIKKLRSPEYNVTMNVLVEFEDKVKDMVQSSIDEVLLFLSGAAKDLADVISRISPFAIGRLSPVGTFLRRMVLMLNKLTLSQSIKVHRLYQQYYARGMSEVESIHKLGPSSEMDFSNEFEIKTRSFFCTLFTDSHAVAEMTDLEAEIISWSRKQTELFLANQATLLHFDENSALPPAQLHTQLNEIVQINPDYAEAYYVLYLNCLRVREYNGAVDYLHKYFDSVGLSFKGDDKTKCYRYAALNLAILHAYFNNKEASLNSLKESLMLAHSSNDVHCLYIAYTWYRYLNADKEIERVNTIIPKCEEMRMNSACSISLQTYAREFVLKGQSPNSAFQMLTRSDMINSQQMLHDFILLGFANKSAIWDSLGKQSMSFALSQIALCLNLPLIFDSLNEYNTEAVCVSICNCAIYLLQEGNYHFARIALNHAKERFPNRYSEWWKLCDQVAYFEYALSLELWNDAYKAASQIAAVDVDESTLRHAQLCLAKGDKQGAFDYASKMVHPEMCPVKRPRAYLLVSSSIPTVAFKWLTNALDVASHFKLVYFLAIIKLELAKLQFQMGFIKEALSLLRQCKVIIFSENRLVYQAEYFILRARCKAASTSVTNDEDKKKEKIKYALDMLETAKELFIQLQCNSRIKDILYLQALFANEVGLNEIRNTCSLEFRNYNEYNPTSHLISYPSISF